MNAAAEPVSSQQLLGELYDELRKLAASKLARERPGQTLQATALVHEAFIKLGGDADKKWDSQSHFFGAAAEAMRRILIDNARHKASRRAGGEFRRTEFRETGVFAPGADDEVLAVDEALERFESADPESAKLVKLRYFAGLTQEEAADALGISRRTANRRWAYAKAWLFRELSREI